MEASTDDNDTKTRKKQEIDKKLHTQSLFSGKSKVIDVILLRRIKEDEE